MSVEHRRDLQITDESGDFVVFATTSPDDRIGLDDDEAVVVSVKVGTERLVNITRADLQELRLFLEEVAEADKGEFAA